MEKVLNADTQSVTQLFQGCDSRAVVSAADDIIDGGLRYTTQIAELVDGNPALSAQLDNTLSDSLSDVYGYHLFPLR